MMRYLHIFLFILFFSCEAHSQQVLFDGLSPTETSTLFKQIPSLQKTTVSLSIIDRAISQIMKIGRFEGVEVIRRNDGKYVIIASPLRRVRDILLEGNHAASDSQLLDIINIAKKENFEKRRILEVGERLKNFYGELGFFNAVIEVAFEKVDDSQMDIVFKITEGLPCKISKIEFRSANDDLDKRLTLKTKANIGKNLTSDQILRINQKITSFLMEKNYFGSEVKGPTTNYNEDKTQAYIIFEVTNPYRYQIFLEGVDSSQPFYANTDPFKYQKTPNQKRFLPTEGDVRRALVYSEGERSGIEPETDMTNKIRSYYLNKGFPEIKIESDVSQNDKEFKRNVTFKISTGPKVSIKQWNIDGRISRVPRYYISFIKNNSSELIQKGYYNREDLDLGQKNLITELRNQGFLMAKIQSTRIEYLGKSKSDAVITLNLDEGPLTQVRRLEFIGNKSFTDIELENEFLIKSNAPLRLQNLEKSIEKLKKFYLDRGFLEMKILNDEKEIVKYNEKGTHANIELKIYEGPQIRVKSIIVEGNNKTKSEVIRKSLNFEDGDILTPEKIEDSTLYLNRTGIFSRATITTLEQGTDVADRTVIVSVDERDPGLWRLGVGVNSERELTARAFTGLSYNNLFGTARGFSSRVDLSSNVADLNYLEHRVTFGYLEPFMFGTKIKGRVNLTRSDEVFNAYNRQLDGQQLVEILERNRIDFLLESDITRHLKLTWTAWGLDSRTNRELKNRCPDNTASVCSSTTIQIPNIGPVLDLDYRDNPFLPTRGNYSRLGIDYSAPFLVRAIGLDDTPGIEFVKLDGTYRHYFPIIAPRLIWANEFRSGYLSNLSNIKDSGVPTSHAFFLGSFSTVRGYDFTNDNNRIPKGSNVVNSNDETRLPVTSANEKIIKSDSYYYMVKTELRFPIWGEFGGVIFYDGGAVLVSGYHFQDP
ncbi:MAG: BamA/TamA family outer membrane protein, partial [Bdellovibrionales bacterium]|nr:BamA/TamA family outer membrane protein [Bdellovibrionales bacterium]